MIAKILARSKNREGEENKGTMLKMEDKESKKGYTWYFMTDEVTKYVDNNNISHGDEVEFRADEIKGEDTIIFIKKVGGGSETRTKTYGKSPEEQESIKRQAIMHAVSRTIVGLDGVDLNNVLSVIDTLYKKYQEVVG